MNVEALTAIDKLLFRNLLYRDLAECTISEGGAEAVAARADLDRLLAERADLAARREIIVLGGVFDEEAPAREVPQEIVNAALRPLAEMIQMLRKLTVEETDRVPAATAERNRQTLDAMVALFRAVGGVEKERESPTRESPA
jgi:hypothetical protein